MEGCRCGPGCRSSASWLPFSGTFIHDKTAGRFQIRYLECSHCHAVEASVVDRGLWGKIEFSMEYRWQTVLAGPQTPYSYPSTTIIPQHAGGAVFRWVDQNGHELHLGETDELRRYLRRLARPSNRSRLRRLLDDCVAQRQQVGVEWLDTPAFRLGEVLMSAVGLRDQATRRLIVAGIQAERSLNRRLQRLSL